MPKKILWLDNEPRMIEPFVLILRDEGYEVDVAPTLQRADYLLKTKRYNLLLLDVMIPTLDEEEEMRYSPDRTDFGLKTGLVFYEVNRSLLDAASTQVLVMTMRMDKDIFEEFVAAGLPETCISTKLEMSEVNTFIEKIESLI